jgi:hypothetical protein
MSSFVGFSAFLALPLPLLEAVFPIFPRKKCSTNDLGKETNSTHRLLGNIMDSIVHSEESAARVSKNGRLA